MEPHRPGPSRYYFLSRPYLSGSFPIPYTQHSFLQPYHKEASSRDRGSPGTEQEALTAESVLLFPLVLQEPSPYPASQTCGSQLDVTLSPCGIWQYLEMFLIVITGEGV